MWAWTEQGRRKEGCALMVSPRVGARMEKFGWFGSRIVWMTGKVGMVKCVWVCVYAPVNEKGMKGKMKLEEFREDLRQLLKKFENVRRVFLLGDMNMRIGNTEIGGVVGKYDVEGVNENGQYLVDICAERGLFLLNTFFRHKMIHRYTWARGNKRSLTDYILIAVDNRLRREVKDAKAVRGLFSDSNHFAVVAKVRMRERWEQRWAFRTNVREPLSADLFGPAKSRIWVRRFGFGPTSKKIQTSGFGTSFFRESEPPYPGKNSKKRRRPNIGFQLFRGIQMW